MQDAVFVFGALRSGTTVFRLMLDAHDRLSNPGEADFLLDFLIGEGGGWRYDLDALRRNRIFRAKRLDLRPGLDGLDLLRDLLGQFHARAAGRVLTLNIHRHIDRLAEVLPGVRVIHILRDPRDVARSSIGMGWAGHVYHGVDHWIVTERQWDLAAPRLVPGQVFELHYEALIAVPEAELTRVCGFLGVPFSPAMLSYAGKTSYAAPDPKLIEQWRRSLSPRDIGLLEGKAGVLMAARGYALSGHPVLEPGPLGRAWLAAASKLRVWREAARVHGTATVVLEKLTRHLGWRAANLRLRGQMDATVEKQLK